MDIIRKTWPTTILRGANEGKGPIRFIASSARSDSYDDVVVQDWILDEFKGNPVVPWGHDYLSPPVGRVVGITVEAASDYGHDTPVLLADIEFDEEDPDAAKIASKYRRGFLSAVSVGFAPGERIPRSGLSKDDPLYSTRGMVYRKNVLKEISAVTVPANPDALAMRGGVPRAASLKAELLRLLRTDAELRAEMEATMFLRSEPTPDWDISRMFGRCA